MRRSENEHSSHQPVVQCLIGSILERVVPFETPGMRDYRQFSSSIRHCVIASAYGRVMLSWEPQPPTELPPEFSPVTPDSAGSNPTREKPNWELLQNKSTAWSPMLEYTAWVQKSEGGIVQCAERGWIIYTRKIRIWSGRVVFRCGRAVDVPGVNRLS